MWQLLIGVKSYLIGLKVSNYSKLNEGFGLNKNTCICIIYLYKIHFTKLKIFNDILIHYNIKI